MTTYSNIFFDYLDDIIDGELGKAPPADMLAGMIAAMERKTLLLKLELRERDGTSNPDVSDAPAAA